MDVSVMHYMGGKHRLATHIVPILLSAREGRTAYVEPFLGGGSVAALAAPHFERVVLADVVPDLVLLWSAVLEGWVPPDDVTEEEWRELRDADSSALRGFAGFACSFGGKWFAGYARDPRKRLTFAQTAARGLARKAEGMAGAEVRLADYRDLVDVIGPDAVVYADPPYAGTTGYGAAGGFDGDAFWDEMRLWANKGAAVFVSEYAAPDDWVEVWSAAPRGTLALGGNVGRVTERLFTSPDVAASLH